MKETAAAEAKKRDAELRAMYVVVPPGDEAKSIHCPICQESIKCKFLEDEEEWVWPNAVKKDDKVSPLVTS
jgi:pre-mRNA cleavage complex 2 protein Pcf11